MKTRSAQASLERWLQPRKRRRRDARDPDPGAVSLGDIISKLDPGLHPQYPAAPPITQSDWEKIVGPRIADRSSPERLEPDGTLIVRVPASVWAQELSMLSTSVINRIGAFGLRVSRLRMTVGDPPQQLRPTSQRFVRHVVAAPAPLPPAVQCCIDDIDDSALRASILAAATASLSEAAADERRARAAARRGPRRSRR
jgi:hypothetical protein